MKYIYTRLVLLIYLWGLDDMVVWLSKNVPFTLNVAVRHINENKTEKDCDLYMIIYDNLCVRGKVECPLHPTVCQNSLRRGLK